MLLIYGDEISSSSILCCDPGFAVPQFVVRSIFRCVFNIHGAPRWMVITVMKIPKKKQIEGHGCSPEFSGVVV